MASAIVLLAKLKCFPGRSIPSRLHNAWKMYIQWCHKNGKNTNIEDFSLREFKMKSNLGIDRCFNKDSKIHDYRKYHLCAGRCLRARNNAFPTAHGGKGADTAILSSWLEDAMDEMVTW